MTCTVEHMLYNHTCNCSLGSEDEEDGILSRDGPGGRQLRGVALRKRSQVQVLWAIVKKLLYKMNVDVYAIKYILLHSMACVSFASYRIIEL